MGSTTGAWERVGNIVGWAAVLAAFALFSPGVSLVRADDDAPMSVDPGLAAVQTPPQKSAAVAPAPAQKVADPAPSSPTATPTATDPSKSAPSQPFVQVDDLENARRPGVSGIEIQPGVVVLNTRGYNYGPPPTPLEPEALDQEDAQR